MKKYTGVLQIGVAAHENCIYAIGGSDGMIQLNSGEKYDIDVDTWQRIAPMNTRRMGKIFSFG